MRAIQWAIERGYKHIGLIGYDCSIKRGSHFHGDHKFEKASPLNGKKMDRWHKQFLKVEKKARIEKVDVFNCSRYTELGCFPIMNLEDAF